MTTSYRNLIECQTEQQRIRALLEAVEAERDVARAEVVAVIENYGAPEEDETLAQVVERIYKNAEEGWGRAGDLQAAFFASQAGEARAVEALRRIHEGATRQLAEPRNHDDDQYALTSIATECEAVSVGHPALDWLAQREREAAAVEVERIAGECNSLLILRQIFLNRAAALRAGKGVGNDSHA